MKASLKDGLLVAASIALPIILADIVLKGLQLPKSSSRTMLLAGSPLYSDGKGYRRYDNSRELEQSAVYGSSIAYRYRARSNNLGLISAPDIQPGQNVDLTIVGDSFSEGQGGFAWVPQLQKEWLQQQGLLSINYAIAGSGFEDFAVTAKIAKEEHKASRVLILFIEHDAYRPYQTMASNQSCSFYSNGILDQLLGPFTCGLYGIVWHHIPLGLSDQQLIQASIARQNYGVVPAITQLLQQITSQAKRSNPAPAPTQAAEPSAPRKPGATAESQAPQALRFGPLPPASIAAISRIRRLYGNRHVLMVQLPDQPAAAMAAQQGARQRFQQNLRRASGQQVIDLAATCQLQPDDFHQLDNHPNRQGYARLATCVQNHPMIRSFIQAASRPPSQS